MKTKTNIIIALIVAGTTIGVYAEKSSPERDGSRKEEHKAKILERFDKDGDGELSRKERGHAKKSQEKRENRGENGKKRDGSCEKKGEKGERGERGEKGERGNRGQSGGGRK